MIELNKLQASVDQQQGCILQMQDMKLTNQHFHVLQYGPSSSLIRHFHVLYFSAHRLQTQVLHMS